MMQSNHFELGLGRGALREDVDGIIEKKKDGAEDLSLHYKSIEQSAGDAVCISMFMLSSHSRGLRSNMYR